MELSKMEQRYQAVMAVQVDGLTVTEVADKFGVSRQTMQENQRRAIVPRACIVHGQVGHRCHRFACIMFGHLIGDCS